VLMLVANAGSAAFARIIAADLAFGHSYSPMR
jgi:hypothetical protein